MKTEMTTSLAMLSPKQAREILKKNTINRPLRPGVVEKHYDAYMRGEWKITHQGIALTSDGRVLDGQHRLTFIASLPESSRVPINVSIDCDESSFDAIDIGCNRSMSDVYGISGALTAVGRFFTKLAEPTEKATNQFTKPFIDWVTPEFEELMTYCPTSRQVWSSSAVRSAAIYQIKRGHDADFVKLSYGSLVRSDVDLMPFGARAIMGQYISGKIVSGRGVDLFCRALRAFDSTQTKKIKNILIIDQAGTIQKVRNFINEEMKKNPGISGFKGVKPQADFNWKKAA